MILYGKVVALVPDCNNETIGALRVSTESGATFSVSEGLSVDQKVRWGIINGPVSFYEEVLGKIVKVRCDGFTSNGFPKDPVFLEVLEEGGRFCETY